MKKVFSVFFAVLAISCSDDSSFDKDINDPTDTDKDTDTDTDTNTDTDTDTDTVSSEEMGELTLEIWGENYCETGLPSKVFADGYSVVFDKFLVSLTGATVEGTDLLPAIEISSSTVWDLVKPGPHTISTVQAFAGTYNETSFSTNVATSESTAGNAESDDVKLMIDGEYVFYVSGTATLGETIKTFKWGFTEQKTYQCQSIGVLQADGSATVQLTIHVDHVFTTDLSDFTNHFDEIAQADSNADGEVTQAELEKITEGYNGGVYINADNFWDYLNKETTYLGHVDGERECL